MCRALVMPDDVQMLRTTATIIRGCEDADDNMSGVRQGNALSDRLEALANRFDACATNYPRSAMWLR